MTYHIKNLILTLLTLVCLLTAAIAQQRPYRLSDRLTGTWRLNLSRSDDPRTVVERALGRDRNNNNNNNANVSGASRRRIRLSWALLLLLLLRSLPKARSTTVRGSSLRDEFKRQVPVRRSLSR